MRNFYLMIALLTGGVGGAWAEVTTPTFTAKNPTTLTSGWYQIKWVNKNDDTNSPYTDSELEGKYVWNYSQDVTVSTSDYALYLDDAPATASDHAKTFVYFSKNEDISATGVNGNLRSANGRYISQSGASSLNAPANLNYIIYFSSSDPTRSVISSGTQSVPTRYSLVPMGKGATPYIGQTVANKFPKVEFSLVTLSDLGLQAWTVYINGLGESLASDNTQITYKGTGVYGLTKVYNNGTFFIDSSVTPLESDLTIPSKDGFTSTTNIDTSAKTITVNYSTTYSCTLTDENGGQHKGSITGIMGVSPSCGCQDLSISSETWDYSGKTYTANVSFPFPVSSNSVTNATAIQSALGSAKWYAKDGKVISDNSANTPKIYEETNANNYRWYIYPVFSAGKFYFALYNVGAAKYIPNNPSNASGTATTLTDNPASAGGFLYSNYSQGNGFFDETSSKFLTINSDAAGQNIWLWEWNGSSTHKGSVMSFPELNAVNATTTFAAMKAAAKFDILEGSTVQGPSEFADPESINTAIDAAQEVAETTDAKITFIESANGTKIQTYLNKVAQYGALANIQFTMSKEYGTMILPCPCSRITGLDIYSCSAQVDGVLTLTPVDGDYEYNKPYIIHATEGNKYTIIGWDKGSTSTHTAGWLTGVLNSTTDIPSGSYMLATNKSTGVQAFYQVSGSGVKCAINKCYLTVPTPGVKAFFLDVDGISTSIDEVFGEHIEQGAIFNLAGQRMSRVQKGVNIVNGKKVLVK